MTPDTEGQNTEASCSTVAVAANSASPCAECPWRVSNLNRLSPATGTREDYFTLDAVGSRWTANIRSGARQTCHLSDPSYAHGDDPQWHAAGFAAVKPGSQPRQCAGAVAAATREVQRLKDAGSWDAYHLEYPHGLTLDSARMWLSRFRGNSTQPTRPVTATDDIADAPAMGALKAEHILTPDLVDRLSEILTSQKERP